MNILAENDCEVNDANIQISLEKRIVKAEKQLLQRLMSCFLNLAGFLPHKVYLFWILLLFLHRKSLDNLNTTDKNN